MQGLQFDQLIVAGDALLNGLLDVPLVGGFVPAQGDMFEILTAGNVTGQFSLLGLPAVASGTGLTWQVHYNPGDVTLEVLTALLGDYNGNGVVDAPDYVVWRNTLGQSPPGLAADGDGDGMIDADDYNIWKAHFGQTAGSAGASANAAVPEPTTWILIIVAAGVSDKAWPHKKSHQLINAQHWSIIVRQALTSPKSTASFVMKNFGKEVDRCDEAIEKARYASQRRRKHFISPLRCGRRLRGPAAGVSRSDL